MGGWWVVGGWSEKAKSMLHSILMKAKVEIVVELGNKDFRD